MADLYIYQFPAKTTPVGADLIYVGDSSDSFSEVKVTFTDVISSFKLVTYIGSLTAGDIPIVNSSGVLKDSGIAIDTSRNITNVTSVSLTQNPISSLQAATKQYADLKLAIAANLSDLQSAASARSNLGLGNAAVKTVSNNSSTTVVSVTGTITPGNLASFADSSGTIQDGGTTTGFLRAVNNLSDVESAGVSFDTIAPTEAKGDLIINNGSQNVRFTVGPNTYVLTCDDTSPTGWSTKPGGGGPGPSNVVLNTIYVSTKGSDSTGSGTIGNPLATRNGALLLIYTLSAPSSTNPYLIYYDVGSYSVSSFKMQPWIFEQGQGSNNTFFTLTGGAQLSLDVPRFASLTASTGITGINFGSNVFAVSAFSVTGAANISVYLNDTPTTGSLCAFVGTSTNTFNLYITKTSFLGGSLSFNSLTSIISYGNNKFFEIVCKSDNGPSTCSLNNELALGSIKIINTIISNPLVFTATNSVRATAIQFQSSYNSITANFDASTYVTPTNIGSYTVVPIRISPAEAVSVALTPANFTLNPAGDKSVEASIKGIDDALAAIGNNSINFNANQTGSPQVIANTTTTKIILNQVLAGTDTANYFNTTLYNFLPLVSGFYELTAQLSFAAPTASGTANIYIYKNDVTLIAQGVVPLVIAVAGATVNVTTGTVLNGSTDFVSVYVSQNTGFTNAGFHFGRY